MPIYFRFVVWTFLPITAFAYAAETRVPLPYRIKPEQVGLPAGSERSSEPFVTRIYKTDEQGTILKKQPEGYPFTPEGTYRLKDDEAPRVHEGVDFTSRPKPNKPPVPLDFKAGVYGIVVKAGDGPWGTIAVEIQNGSFIQFLHSTVSHVKVGDIVSPDTVLGITGRKGSRDIHLHVQAKDKYGNAISPDLAFKAGQKKLESKAKTDKPDPADLDFDPDSYSPVELKVVGREVTAKVEPESKWICEVIGEGGRVDEVVGEFPTYQDAQYASQRWSEDHPESLKLTREREVRLKGSR